MATATAEDDARWQHPRQHRAQMRQPTHWRVAAPAQALGLPQRFANRCAALPPVGAAIRS